MKTVLSVLSFFLIFVGCKKSSDEQTNLDTIYGNLPANEVLYFTSNKSGSYQIYKYEGNNLTQITFDEDHNFWSPRLNKAKTQLLCFRSPDNSDRLTNDYLNAELWMFNLDGSNPRRIFTKNVNGWIQKGFATWVKNDSLLLIAAETTDEFGGGTRWHLFLTKPDGSNPVRITSRPSKFQQPILMEDDSTILYTALPEYESSGKDKDVEVFMGKLRRDSNGVFKIHNEVQLTTNEYMETDINCNQYFDNFFTYTILNTQDTYTKTQVVRTSVLRDYNKYVVDEGQSCRGNFWGANQKFYFSNRPTYFSNFRIERSDDEGNKREIILQIPGANFLNITGYKK